MRGDGVGWLCARLGAACADSCSTNLSTPHFPHLQCTAAQSLGGKFMGCVGPISAFVCIGLEHCIANMFFGEPWAPRAMCL